MTLGDGSLQNEWAPRRMWAKNGDLELGEFELHYVRTLYTHINQIMQKKKKIIISAKKKK